MISAEEDPNNVNLRQQALQRALEHWQPT